MSDSGDAYTLFCKTEYRDTRAHEFLRAKHFQFDYTTKNWYPKEKEVLREWSADDFMGFRNFLMSVVEEGNFALYVLSVADLVHWCRALELWETDFVINSRKSAWTQRTLHSPGEYECLRLEHDGTRYIGRIQVSPNYSLLPLYCLNDHYPPF
jgi:hypothetical protein